MITFMEMKTRKEKEDKAGGIPANFTYLYIQQKLYKLILDKLINTIN